jgi:hypothetical protein
LIIHAKNSSYQYVGEFESNFFYSTEKVKQWLEEDKFRVLSKSDHGLRLKVNSLVDLELKGKETIDL